MDDQRPTGGDDRLRDAWGRVAARLAQHDPGAFAALGRPAAPEAIRAAEQRMGVELPRQVREWLLISDLGHGLPIGPASEEALTAGGPLLGLAGIERTYHLMRGLEAQARPDPAFPFWRREWVPFAAEAECHYGRFVDARTGAVGSWSEGSAAEEGQAGSLAEVFEEAADLLGGVRRPDLAAETDPLRRWARANGFEVNDRGRVPSVIREAYAAHNA